MPNTFLGFPVSRAKFADAVANLSGIVDRGPVSDVDFGIGDLTLDGGDYDLDLSGIVPAEAHWINMLVFLAATGGQGGFSAWKKSDGDQWNADGLFTGDSGGARVAKLTIACDPDRIIQYTAWPVTYTQCDIVVTGWIK
jgi:hypothetical protein